MSGHRCPYEQVFELLDEFALTPDDLPDRGNPTVFRLVLMIAGFREYLAETPYDPNDHDPWRHLQRVLVDFVGEVGDYILVGEESTPAGLHGDPRDEGAEL
jgi:hypothetical protein